MQTPAAMQQPRLVLVLGLEQEDAAVADSEDQPLEFICGKLDTPVCNRRQYFAHRGLLSKPSSRLP